MPIYRKRPVLVSAVQWTEDMCMADLRAFADNWVALDDVNRTFSVYDRLHNTWVSFEYGDWIIRGVQGEFYPCKPDVFDATYEAVDLPPDVQGADAEAVR